MTNKQTAKDKNESLVTRFEDQYQSYKHSDCKETPSRRDFIDPFFKALGWNIDNEAGYAEAYREVIHEDKVKVSGATKADEKINLMEIEINKFLEKDNYSFNFRLFGENSKLFEKMRILNKPLQDYREVKQAIKTGDDSRYIYRIKINACCRPVIGGKEIQRYQINYGNRYVDYGPHLSCPRNHRIFDAQEKILIRETGKRITANIDLKTI